MARHNMVTLAFRRTNVHRAPCSCSYYFSFSKIRVVVVMLVQCNLTGIITFLAVQCSRNVRLKNNSIMFICSIAPLLNS